MNRETQYRFGLSINVGVRLFRESPVWSKNSAELQLPRKTGFTTPTILSFSPLDFTFIRPDAGLIANFNLR